MEFFTTGNGDRSNAANYYILLTRGPSAGNKAAAFGSAIRSIDSSNLFIVDINSGFEKEYEEITGDDSHYFFASSFSNLSSIESLVMEAITKCPVNESPTTTDISWVSNNVPQSSFLIPFLSGIAVGIAVFSFVILFLVILRRHSHHQKMKENDRNSTSYSAEHNTEHGLTVEPGYIVLNTSQRDRTR